MNSSKKTINCKRCVDLPCPIVKATKKLLGVWARERRRQGVGMFGELPSQEAMDEAVAQPVRDLFSAKCDCECHKND